VLARNLRTGIGDELTLIGSGRDGSFAAGIVTVAGVFESGLPDIDRAIAEVPLEYFSDTFFMEGAAHQVIIDAGRLSNVDTVAQTVSAALPTDGSLVVHDWNVLMPGLRQAIQADMSSAFFMYAVLVILVAFSVLNTQLMSVLERTREFGIVLSLGLTPGRLGRLIMLETALMGILGLVIGAILGAAVTSWFAVHGFTMPGMDEMASRFNLPARFYPSVSFLSAVVGPAVVLLFSLIAALYPALRLRWLHPVEAMRSA
jgi:ABC-type lipoprotein release transport system permease subunit